MNPNHEILTSIYPVLLFRMQSVPAEGSNVVVEDETSSDEDLSPEEQSETGFTSS